MVRLALRIKIITLLYSLRFLTSKATPHKSRLAA